MKPGHHTFPPTLRLALKHPGMLLAVIILPVTAMMFLPVARADTDAEASRWLGKMAHALREQDYTGTFTYARGNIFDTVRIVHHFDGVREQERLYNLNGEVREVIREDDQVVCHHPAALHRRISDPATDELARNLPSSSAPSPSPLLHGPVHIGPFSPAFAERVIKSQNLYRLSMHGTDRIADRETVTLAVSPRHQDRYGYRLWLDMETGLLLQSHLVNQGRVKEIFQFTNIDIGMPVTADLLAPTIIGKTVSHQLTLDTQNRPEKPVWKVAWLPDGFRPIRMDRNRLHFSDGLTAFSVFVELSGKASLPEMTTTVGGRVVTTRHLKPSNSLPGPVPVITVVGEVPILTARRVAASVERVVY